MHNLTFVTGNTDKYTTAVHVSKKYDINLQQASPDIDEIQSENAEDIARHKASTAFSILGKPIVISDDSWAITALRGFPGAYMKSMNHWLEVDDFLRLMSQMSDRTCILTQILVYQDTSTQTVFTNQISGHILTKARGDTTMPWAAIVSMDGDNGKSIAEFRESNNDHSERFVADVWHSMLSWYTERQS